MMLAVLTGTARQAFAQDKIINPDISYAGTPRQCEIGGISVEGVEGYGTTCLPDCRACR